MTLEKTDFDNPKIPGEYDHVARRSADAASLKLAHETPMCDTDAEILMQAFGKFHGLPVLAVAWTGTRTKRGGRGRGGLHRPRKRGVGHLSWNGKMRYEWTYGPPIPWVSLPRAPMTIGGEWGGFLRVGIVLHELAHAIGEYKLLLAKREAREQSGSYALVDRTLASQHNYGFVVILDALVAQWRATCR